MPDLLTALRGTTAGTGPAWTPVLVPYRYRERSYPWAQRVLAAAESVHGAPPDTDPDTCIPAGLCQCGCGQATRIAVQSQTRYGQVNGQPVRFVKGHNARLSRTLPARGERCEGCGYLTARCCCEVTR